VDTPVREGEILAGKYRVDRVLGVGGMGVVVAAHHLELDDKVAIKFLLPETLGNAEAVARFAREARAAVKIKSEHVARVSDVGKLENGAPYMVMEHLEGSDLSGWLTERGALPIDQAVEFVLQASEAIAEAHSLGIVHRDLKPANLFVIRRPDGGMSIKVLDFGISKMTSLGGSSGDGSMTKTSTMMGSPIYMSPEQIQSSKDVDSRGDIWALGVILYELITGSAPFGGEHMAELIYRIISGVPPRMQAYRPEVPPGLEAVILHCLEKDRNRRFSSVAEFANALLPFAPPRAFASVERISGVMTGKFPARDPALTSSLGPQSAVGNTGARVVGAGTDASWGKTAAPKSRSPWLLLGGIGAVVLLAVGVLTVKRFTAAAPSAPPSTATAPPVSAANPPPAALPEPTAPPAAVAVTAPATPPAASATASPSAAPPSAVPPPAAPPSAVPPHAKAAAGHPAALATPKANPTSKTPHNSDPWGESQH
jgi:serine/threonine protein kinase